MSASNDAILDRVIAAAERNDIATLEAIYADDIRIWHAHDGVTKSKTLGIAALAGLHRIGTPKYTVLERIHDGQRIAQRHRLVITATNGGRTYQLDTAIFFTIADGKIVEFHEYMDSGQLRVLGEAIEHAIRQDANALAD